MRRLYVVQNTVKLNKNRLKFVIQYYGRLKELFDFNKFAKFISSDHFHDKILVLANIRKCIIFRKKRNIMFYQTDNNMLPSMEQHQVELK